MFLPNEANIILKYPFNTIIVQLGSNGNTDDIMQIQLIIGYHNNNSVEQRLH